MTKVVFETATLADAIKKASTVAPSRGNAFDKAAGIVIELGHQFSVIRATDLNIYSMQWVDQVSFDGELPQMAWRVNSKLFNQVISSLPIGSGKNILLEEQKNGTNTFLQLSAGRTRAKFNLMSMDHYPEWPAFSPDELIPADSLGGKLSQVEWAAAKTDATPQIEGVHFDGEKLIATDRYRLATAELKIPGLPNAVTVPAGILGQILRQTGEVKIGVTEHQLLLMPDESTQIRAILFGGEYPKVARIMKRDSPSKVKVRKAALLEILNRAAGFAGSDRTPTLKCFFGKEEIAVMMDNEEVGLLGDVVEVPGQAQHDRLIIIFTPKNIIDAIEHCPNEEIELGYDQGDASKIMYINGGSGYEAWVVPRRSMDSA